MQKYQHIQDSLFFYIKKAIEAPPQKRLIFLLRGLLWFLSLFWRCLSYFRNIAYDRKWLLSKKAQQVVVSIGNIVAGGTGKTPLIALLLKRLNQKKVCLLSRGYRSEAENSSLVACKGKGPIYNWRKIGDEAHFLAQKFPSTLLIVGKKRDKALELNCVKEANILLLDDGMQYRKIQKDIEIVCMNAKDLFGLGYFLPRGFLRDHPKRLRSADMVLINHVDNEDHFACLKKQVVHYTSAPIVGAKSKLTAFRSYHTHEILDLRNEKVGLFCNIANPTSFYQMIQQQGLEIVETCFGLDHKPINEEKLRQFVRLCDKKQASMLVCTEKDCVKLPKALNVDLPIVYSEMELEIIYNKNGFEEVIEKIVSNV